jgi:hypothetical protein
VTSCPGDTTSSPSMLYNLESKKEAITVKSGVGNSRKTKKRLVQARLLEYGPVEELDFGGDLVEDGLVALQH